MVDDSSPAHDLSWATRIIEVPGTGDYLAQRKLGLSVVAGPDKGARVVMEQDRLLIGTHARCDLTLTDDSVSRHHAELRIASHGLLLQDLGSTNGTWVRGLRVNEVLLPEAEEIALGSTRIQLEALDEEVRLPLEPGGRFGELHGTSQVMRVLFARLKRAADKNVTVLLEGESGTGKELAARALHDHGPRRDGPFVVVDCGALPRELIESELFGHERGAFTGAHHSRQGAFEQASGGTVFLDEIGELDLELQPRLLRVLESREVKRLGSNQRRPVDIRVVAATNRHLQQLVAEGAFREDLFYRLAVVQIDIPPLRERREDIPRLVRLFIEQLTEGDERFQISQAMMDRLASRAWPGNVRELRNVVERAVVMEGEVEPAPAAAQPVTPSHEVERGDLSQPYKVARAQVLERFEVDYLEALLERNQGNLSQSARDAKINRVYLLRLLDKYDMRKR